jgi:hypothetical protein
MMKMEDAIKGILQREGDAMGVNLLRYRSVAKDVFRTLNLSKIRQTKRVWLTVDKRTNSVKVPPYYMFFSSLTIQDDCGRWIPLVINSNIVRDVVDISQDKNCHCECGCNSSACGQIQNYELVEEKVMAKMPDGTQKEFDTYTRKKINKDGSMVIEKSFPKAMYDGGEWVDTAIAVEEEFLCKLEVKECGCLKETKGNMDKIHECCGDAFFSVECGGTCCTPQSSLTFNISETGDRFDFPSGFHYPKVLLRFFYDAPLKELMIPVVAKKAIMLGIKAEIAEFDGTESLGRIDFYKKSYNQEAEKLHQLLQRFSLRNFYEYVLGHKKML